MATLFEYYTTGDDGSASFWLSEWRAQTFTPAIAHKITSVKLLIYRVDLPGTITVSIKATDENGHPTGDDLCSGTTNGNTLPWATWEWREITLGAGYNLSADTKYAIVVRALDGDATNYCRWRRDGTDPTYAGGNYEASDDSGANWSGYTDYDCLFEDWGEPLYTTHELTVTDGIALSDALVKMPIKIISDGIALSDVLVGYKILVQVLTDGIAVTDTLVKTISKTLTDGIAFKDTLVKTASKTLSDGIAFTDSLWKVWTHGVLRILNAVRNLPSIREEGTKR